jgi:hypothetical protein
MRAAVDRVGMWKERKVGPISGHAQTPLQLPGMQ